ncbi:MAG: dTDP-4-dehydrorhamnose reductase [Cytophagales bacterium]|nr:dTDP-4-dehydrorhamnose reductase [Bernardetiaceae bacterium]MDW8211694.1 dTDP-4-dehydrorhamnose reductase [Cytophagales bacterium]
MNKPIILVTGANGQLGCTLQQIAAQCPGAFEWVFASYQALDITKVEQIELYFERHRPLWCINAAAYTAVDKAETERQRAQAVNTEAVGLLAQACQRYQTTLLHISTDFVFDGSKSVPFKEEDAAHPLNYYGLTKLKGEELLQRMGIPFVIVRTSWLYSPYGNNFVKTMLRLGKERGKVSVVDDQIGTPTFAEDLARALVHIIQHDHSRQPLHGIYHYSNEGVASWYDFAHAIFEYAAMKVQVIPIPTSAYPTAAKRPCFSLLSKSKIKEKFGLEISHWRQSLQRCLGMMLSNQV